LPEKALNGGSVQPPLAIDRVERARGQGDQVRLRLSGHWLTARDVADLDALLVVQIDGRRHRFPAARHADGDASAADGWAASFTVPDWAVPDQIGQASLWVGTSIVPVPPPGTTAEELAATAPARPPESELGAEPSALAVPPAGGSGASGDIGRSGPLAEVLLKETVAALHVELERRATEVARLRGALAHARAELDSRGQREGQLESAHAELRHELGELMSAVTRQRAEFEQQLSAARAGAEEHERQRDRIGIERDEARAERDAARAELERARAETETARHEIEQLRAELEAQLSRVRDDTEARLSAARAELDVHLQTARHEFEQQAAAIRNQGDAEAARLDERLAEATAGERRRAQEAVALREQLATAQISRDAALSEAEGLRGELERLGTELSVTREQASGPGADLGEAQQLLADARALTEQLRGASSI
jgi:uncharacterized coiled-coil DUF342 family protein